MTGQGQGRTQYGSAEITAEVRAVNNRHLKIQLRTSDTLAGLESQIESLIRSKLRRGSLQVSVMLSGSEHVSDYEIQFHLLESYYRQCQQMSERLGIASVDLGQLLGLPGVVSETRPSAFSCEVDPELAGQVMETVNSSLDCLNRMRATEGDSMRSELLRQLDSLEQFAAQIEQRAPGVVEDYRERLSNKLSKALAEFEQTLQPADVVREVLLMAEKADIREEIVRLRSHVEQFRDLLDAADSQGRKLDFLIQEMFRETNTIGAKAGDALIAQRVVDAKSVIEQMRELVQNVE